MSWPKHNYAWVVQSPYGHLMRDNGSGYFYDGGFGEVFLDKNAALWVRDDHRRSCRALGWDARTREKWKKIAKGYRVLKIALPGTYTQFKAPGQVERELQKQQRLAALQGGT